jgi:hypothetical protein
LIGQPSLEQFAVDACEQFAVDAWHAPERIFDAHPPDQYTQLGVDLRLAGYRPREKLVVPLVGTRPAPRRTPQLLEIIGGPAGLEPATRPL